MAPSLCGTCFCVHLLKIIFYDHDDLRSENDPETPLTEVPPPL